MKSTKSKIISNLAIFVLAKICVACAVGSTSPPLPSAPVIMNPPSQYFDLSNWELDLPVDVYGGAGGAGGQQYVAQIIPGTTLTNAYVNNYFYANTLGRIVFTAPSNGAVLQLNTPDHTRSELREVYTGAGALPQNYWSNNIGGTLAATCTVQSVSVNSDVATIGQFKNQTQPFIEIDYRPRQQDVVVHIVTTYLGSASTRTVLATGIGLNSQIKYQMSYNRDTLTIKVNDMARNFSIDPSWEGTPVTAKLGAYHTVTNTGNPPGDQTQVTCYNISIAHP